MGNQKATVIKPSGEYEMQHVAALVILWQSIDIQRE